LRFCVVVSIEVHISSTRTTIIVPTNHTVVTVDVRVWLLLLTFLPAYCIFAIQTWGRPHYEFSPLAMIGAGVLLRARVSEASGGLRVWPLVLIGLSVVALGWAVAWRSTAPVPVALILTIAAVGWASGGPRLIRAWWPALALLLLTLRLPFTLDFALVRWLRDLTTTTGSRILDGIGSDHVLTGNVIELGSRQLLVEDACSGVNSLFSTLACTLFLAGLARRGAIHTLALLISVVGWVIVANTVRVVLVVLAAERGFDLATGWRHDALGFLTYALGLALTLSTDRLLLAVSQPTHTDARPPVTVPEDSAAIRLRVPGGWLTVALFTLVAAGTVAVFGETIRNHFFGTHRQLLEQSQRLQKDSLPTSGPGWTLREFETTARNPGSQFGDYSRIWTGRLGRAKVTVSFDFPFREWHPLGDCYIAQGWTVQGIETILTNESQLKPHRLTLTRSGSVHGTLLFTEFDPTGRAIGPPRQQPLQEYFGTVFQLQLLIVSPVPLSAAEEATAAEMFTLMRSSIFQSLTIPEPSNQ
jgi:exosortase